MAVRTQRVSVAPLRSTTPNKIRSFLESAPAVLTAFLFVFAGHTLLTFHFYRPEVIWADLPLLGADFDTHFGHASRFVQAMKGWGEIWSYDPSLLAGHPAGVLFDLDNKAWNLWTYALNALGVSVPRAFNSFVIAASLSVPPASFYGARLFGMSPWQAVLFCFTSSTIWFFDSQTHYFWWIGMSAWSLASNLALIPLGLFYRYVRRPALATGGGAALTLAGILLVHPLSFFILILPMGALYLRASKTLERRGHLGVWSMAACAIVLNGFWLWPALRFLHYGLEAPFYSQAPISAIWHDFLNLAMDPNHTAVYMRSGLRFLVFGAGTAGLLVWRRQRDDRLLPLAIAAVALTLETYLGSYSKLTAQIQPYRFVVPATVWMALPAVAFATHEATRRGFRVAEAPVRAAVIVLGLSTLQLLAHDIFYHFPSAVPRMPGRPAGPEEGITPTGYPRHDDRRHPATPPFGGGTVHWFRTHPVRGRVLVEPNVLGERLAALVPGLEVMGGIRERNLTHVLSNFFRLYPGREASPQVFSSYLRRYGVTWVVLDGFFGFPEKYRDLLTVRADWKTVLICEVNQPTELLAQGQGRVRASINRIDVEDTNPRETVLLRYHWLETLACEPDCRASRAADPDDPVGFIRIDPPHPVSFRIENRY